MGTKSHWMEGGGREGSHEERRPPVDRLFVQRLVQRLEQACSSLLPSSPQLLQKMFSLHPFRQSSSFSPLFPEPTPQLVSRGKTFRKRGADL